MSDDATERLLKEQARAHGLDAYAPEPEGVAPKTIAYAIRQDAERDEAALRGFAGLRGGASSSFEIGAQWSAAPAPPAPAPIGLDLAAFEEMLAAAKALLPQLGDLLDERADAPERDVAINVSGDGRAHFDHHALRKAETRTRGVLLLEGCCSHAGFDEGEWKS